MTHLIFRVEYTELARGRHQFDVDAGEDRTARINAPELGDGLRFAVAFMRGVLELDPIEAAWRLPAAPDGPRDLG